MDQDVGLIGILVIAQIERCRVGHIVKRAIDVGLQLSIDNQFLIFGAHCTSERGAVVKDVHTRESEEHVFVYRQVFQVAAQHPLVHIGRLVRSRINVTTIYNGVSAIRKQVAVSARKVQQLNATQTGKDTFEANFTGHTAKVVTQLEVYTLKVALVTLDHGVAHRHFATTRKDHGFVKDIVDTRR